LFISYLQFIRRLTTSVVGLWEQCAILILFLAELVGGIYDKYFNEKPIPVVARSKEGVYGRSLAGIAGSNPAGAWMSVSCECRQVEFSASG